MSQQDMGILDFAPLRYFLDTSLCMFFFFLCLALNDFPLSIRSAKPSCELLV